MVSNLAYVNPGARLADNVKVSLSPLLMRMLK